MGAAQASAAILNGVFPSTSSRAEQGSALVEESVGSRWERRNSCSQLPLKMMVIQRWSRANNATRVASGATQECVKRPRTRRVEHNASGAMCPTNFDSAPVGRCPCSRSAGVQRCRNPVSKHLSRGARMSAISPSMCTCGACAWATLALSEPLEFCRMRSVESANTSRAVFPRLREVRA